MSDGSRHWLRQRFTAIALVPLGFWFLSGVLSLPDGAHATVSRWLSQPLATIFMALFTAAALWHSMQGMQVIVDDYVHGSFHGRVVAVLRILHVALALAAAWAIATIALAGPS